MKKIILQRIAAISVSAILAVTNFVGMANVWAKEETAGVTSNIVDERQSVSAFSRNFIEAESNVSQKNINSEYENVYLMKKGNKAVFSVNVSERGAYNISLIFNDAKETAESYDFALTVDGTAPFDGSQALTVNTLWEDDGDVRTLASGDQIAPSQRHTNGFKTRLITDSSGINLKPYEFNMSAGVHKIAITASGTDFILAGIKLTTPETVSDYSDILNEYADKDKYTGKQIVIEAEKPLYKNSFSLTSKSDNGSASISPKSSGKSVINYIGGVSWNSSGDEIAWEFEAPKDGLYKIGFSFKQSEVNHGSVYRHLKIDGKTPFSEAENITFKYTTKWKFKSFADQSGNDYLIYLSEGKHIISLAVTLSDVSEVFKRLSEIVEPLGNNYLDMVMITGESPDANRNYQLQKQIPDFEITLRNISKNIDTLSGDIAAGLNVNGELDGALKNMDRILNEMLGSLYNCHTQIPSYFSAYQTLSAWLYDIKTMSLSLDQIVLAAPEKEFVTPQASFWQRVVFFLSQFANSYIDSDNSIISCGDDKAPTLKLWVNWGRDQVKALSNLVQDAFVAQNKVNVKIEQVNASLVQGVVSGNSPDLYLHMARTEPVNLAMRGVICDLKQFDDYEEVLKNFRSGAEEPYLYNDGCYALPDTQSFYIMFYRTDILKQLGIEVPRTWDDFITATGILQRNKLNTYLPYVKITAATTVNTGAGGLSIFPTLLLQSGGSIYNDKQNATLLGSSVSVATFNFWTDFYTKYSLEPDANFIQKFRVGTAPIGITSYNTYMTWKATAPEINGKWKIAEIPGVKDKNGIINNTCSGSGTGCVIMKSSKNKDAAWEFLKWWVSADTQYRYSVEIEQALGETGRVATSNIEALSRFSWDEDALSVINAQWDKVKEIPEVPGSYFVSRSIDQAFWAAKNGKKSPKEAIMDWSDICDKEVERKIAEYADKKFEG